ncbi:MAG: PilZ domain-containing protein [Deltaproteobacteria bacterium]|nr:PilZ domain-containing protein [Deltaproteobacteria bacterium]MBW2067322.1 PilZ domain-containing protein [Deltaproteobacteria bacterium]
MEKLPLEIEQVIYVKPLRKSGSPHKARSQVVGARHGEFVIINEPKIYISDHLISIVEGELECYLENDGEVYIFRSFLRKVIEDGLAFIDYPRSFEVKQLRKYFRVRVNLEARAHLARLREVFSGVVQDISKGGCRLVLDSLIVVPLNAELTLDFVLPNNVAVNGITGRAKSVKYDRLHQHTVIGVQFTGPKREVEKIRGFCEMCEFFKV